MTNLQRKSLLRDAVNLKLNQVIVLFVALVISIVLAVFHKIAFYPFVFGLFFGFILQRSRFCFVSAYRDMLLIRNTAQTRAVIIAILLTSLGFTVIHFSSSHMDLALAGRIYPAGLHTIAGGVIFGIGMVLAGACVSGCLIRMGEGYVMQVVTFSGLLLGSLVGAWHLDWWFQASINTSPKVFLPELLGWPLAIGIQLFLLVFFYVASMKIENTNKVFSIFKSGSNAMPYGKAAVYIALGNILLLVTYGRPWGITSGLTHFAGWLAGSLGVPIQTWLYFNLNHATNEPEAGFLLHPLFFLALAMIIGSLAASLLNREFRWRFPRTKKYYLAALVGGVCMGYGSRLAIGCNIGALFSGIASFSLHGWLFAAALLPGAYCGGKLLVRYLLK